MLGPPRWFKREWLDANGRKSLDLFTRYRRNAGGVVPSGGTTVQGVYCMTPDGEFLSGYFAWAFKDKAKRVLQQGWNRYQQLAAERGWKPQPIPQTRPSYALGNPTKPGGLKLQAAVRDLPRGENRRPGGSAFQRAAYNMGWTDLTPAEAAAFLPNPGGSTKVPQQVVWKLSPTLKDCVRGQGADWKKGALRQSELTSTEVSRRGDSVRLRIQGFIRLEENGRSFACQLYGQAEVDRRTREFQQFHLVAAGQRGGRSKFNFRDQDDTGPAPMGVVYRLHRQ